MKLGRPSCRRTFARPSTSLAFRHVLGFQTVGSYHLDMFGTNHMFIDLGEQQGLCDSMHVLRRFDTSLNRAHRSTPHLAAGLRAGNGQPCNTRGPL